MGVSGFIGIVRNRLASRKPLAGCLAGLACLLALGFGSAARAQPSADAIYGVTALDVAAGSVAQGVALLKQYRDAARKQAGNQGIELLQEAGWPNRFAIYETWTDQSAYDLNEKAAHTVELRDKLKPIAGASFDRRDYHVISVGPAKPAAARRGLHAGASRRLSARAGADARGRQAGRRGGAQGRRQSALRRHAIGQGAA